MKKYSRVCAEISLDAILHNFEVMHGKMHPEAKICAVVKADCYGHGAVSISRQIQHLPYIWGFACATAEEAMELRSAGITKPIILLGYSFAESDEDLIDYDIRACVFDYETAARLSRTAGMLNHSVKIHLALDTGMGRIGFAPELPSVETICEIAGLPNLEIEGLFTHFAKADIKDHEPAEKQLKLYQDFRELLKIRGIEIPIAHVSNSAGIMRLPEANLTMARAGITIYGLTPSDEVADEMTELWPAMTLRSHLTFVKTLHAGQSVSYGGTWTAEKDTRVATVPVGYADGYPRQLSNKGSVLIHGTRVPIIGRVCMDQFMVDVSALENAAAGDEVVLLGKQGEECITAEEIGGLSGRFNYELVSCITKRVPRNYVRNGMLVEQVDYFHRVW